MMRRYPNPMLLAALSIGLLIAEEACARAGGGGGGGGGGGLLILLPVVLIYAAVVTVLLHKKGREAERALAQASEVDPMWDAERIKARVEHVYFKVQDAWTARNQDIAKSCMTEALYRKHKLQTDEMLKDGRLNVLRSIRLYKVIVIAVNDFKDNCKDYFWAYLEGSMIDYTILEATGHVIKGKADKPEFFRELWKFARVKDEWVLDRIDEHVLTDLLRFHSTTERESGLEDHATPLVNQP